MIKIIWMVVKVAEWWLGSTSMGKTGYCISHTHIHKRNFYLCSQNSPQQAMEFLIFFTICASLTQFPLSTQGKKVNLIKWRNLAGIIITIVIIATSRTNWIVIYTAFYCIQHTHSSLPLSSVSQSSQKTVDELRSALVARGREVERLKHSYEQARHTNQQLRSQVKIWCNGDTHVGTVGLFSYPYGA